MNQIQLNNQSTIMSTEEIQSLNEKWQETIAPNIYFAWSGPLNRSEQARMAKESYKLGEIIAKIKTLQSEGKTICLFLGRTPLEHLPSDRNEAKGNDVWISADISLNPFLDTLYPPQLIDSSDLTQRLYLWLNFNEQEDLILIQGLFDKIVIDQSTVKEFRKHDFAKRFSILLHTPESELIFEDPSWYICSLNEKAFFSKDNYVVNFSQPVISFLNSTKEGKNMQQRMEEFSTGITKVHLETIFHIVEEHKDEKYPYITGYNNKEGKDHYFVVRHPIIQ